MQLLELAKLLLLVWCLRLTTDRLVFLGIVTTGTDNYYIDAFILFFSKDRKNWKLYKDAMSKEQKVNVGPRNFLMCSTLRKSTSRVSTRSASWHK